MRIQETCLGDRHLRLAHTLQGKVNSKKSNKNRFSNFSFIQKKKSSYKELLFLNIFNISVIFVVVVVVDLFEL